MQSGPEGIRNLIVQIHVPVPKINALSLRVKSASAAGVAAGLITLGILGAYAHDRRYGPPPGYSGACYKGPRECGWVGARCWINRYGDEVCNRGHYRCWRKTYCD